MTNDDRELIVLAGHAAGKDIFYDDFHDGAPCYYAEDIDCNIMWNPLEDDGDAFGLAVALHMDINSYPCTQEIGAVQHKHNKICDGNQHRMFEKTWQQDAFSATRRAIVRAAAEIGRTKP